MRGADGELRGGAQPAPGRPPVLPRDDLRELAGYHSPQVEATVRLNTNESPIPPPAGFLAAVMQELGAVAWHRYPDRQAWQLRSAIAEFHDVEPEMVLAGNGSNEVIQLILLAYGGSGRTVATFEPSYQLHAHIARVSGARTITIERQPDFSLDRAQIRHVVQELAPDVTFLTTPNNPTGMLEPRENIEQAATGAQGIVVIDEAYVEFAESSALPLVAEDRPLAVVRTFSKTWSMASLRLGYVVAPNWLVAELEKVVLPYHLDAFKQLAGRVALRYAKETGSRVEKIVSERARLSLELERLGLEVFPSSANFILFRTQDIRAVDLWQSLVNRDVLIRDCSSWPRLEGCLRVTVGTPEENDHFLAAIESVFMRLP